MQEMQGAHQNRYQYRGHSVREMRLKDILQGKAQRKESHFRQIKDGF
jgi:hypothetical protein